MAIKAGQLKERADYQAYILEMLRKENGQQPIIYEKSYETYNTMSYIIMMVR